MSHRRLNSVSQVKSLLFAFAPIALASLAASQQVSYHCDCRNGEDKGGTAQDCDTASMECCRDCENNGGVGFFGCETWPRLPIRLPLAGQTAGGFSLATDADLSAVVAVDANQEVQLMTSDGKGIGWSGPQRADSDSTGAPKLVVQGTNPILGGRFYCLWKEDGGATSELHYNIYDEATMQFVGDTVVPKATPGVSTVEDYHAAGTKDGSATIELFHVAQVVRTPGGSDQLVVVSVYNGVPLPSAVLATDVAIRNVHLAAEGDKLVVAWEDSRNGVFHAFVRSSGDGGLTFGGETQVSGAKAGEAGDMNVGLTRNTVVISWAEAVPGTKEEQLVVVVSTDGGNSYGFPTVVGSYVAGVHDVDEPSTAVQLSQNILVTWVDNRTGADEVYFTSSLDGGSTWSVDQRLSNNPVCSAGGDSPRIAPSQSNDKAVAAYLTRGTEHLNGLIGFSYFDDIGAIARPGIAGDTGSLSGPIDLVWNELYSNWIWAYESDADGPPGLYAGGLRPQSIMGDGFVAGPTAISFVFNQFDVTASNTAWGLFAASPGSHLLPDGRCLGLAGDSLLFASLELALSGITEATLSPDGMGTSPPLTTSLPAGLSIYAVGLTIDPAFGVGELTDTMLIQVQVPAP